MGIFSFTVSLADSSVSAVVLYSDDTAELLSCCDTAEGVFSAAQALQKGINQRIAIQWDFPITFEMARAYQKANGKYLRQNQWEDITLVMSLELGR